MKQPRAGNLMTLKQVAALFEVNRKTILRWRKEKQFPNPVSYGGIERWRGEDVLMWKQAEEAKKLLGLLGTGSDFLGTSEPQGENATGKSKRSS